MAIYRPFFEYSHCPLEKALLKNFEDLFYTHSISSGATFSLAHKIERAHELGAERATVVGMAPPLIPSYFRLRRPTAHTGEHGSRSLAQACPS